MAIKLTNHPVLCNYYVTYRCNASCSFCDIWEKPSPYISFEQVEANLIALKKLKVRVIDFTGGEPLLHRELGDFLALAKKLKFITTVTTNALLYPKRAEELKGKVDMLHFSLDSFDRDTHNASRKVVCYDHVMESIDIAKSLGERPDILFTVTPNNLHEIEALQAFCVSKSLVLILNPMFDYQVLNTDSMFTEEQLKQLSDYGKRKNVFLNEGFITLRKNGGNKIEDPVCFAGEDTVVISPFNELVLPCYHLGLEKFKIDNDLEQLWKSEPVVAMRNLAGKAPECASCTINCYMQPSFSTHVNQYFWKSLPSTSKYNYLKG
ncbi:MAG: radical SAM protein, partial [Maribacter sp.]|nr:radical SAM protein [Maribacter sp.]